MPTKLIECQETMVFDGPYCTTCQWGYSKMTEENQARKLLGTICQCGTPLIHQQKTEVYKWTYRQPICICGSEDAEMRYSLGLPVTEYCDACWDKSGYRKEGGEGYDYLDAGEYYDEDDY